VWEERQAERPDPEAAAERILDDEETLDLLETGAVAGAPAPSSQAAVADGLTNLPEAGIDLRAHLLSIERALVQQALARANGTVAHAARLLSLRRTTLVEKLRKLGIEAATEV
jgi:sigma-54 specific flagellar transcriptional regulator A